MNRFAAMAVMGVSGLAVAGETTITFDDLNKFESLSNQYVDLGIVFNGDLTYWGDFNFENPVVRDLGGFFFGDGDNEAVAAGLGLGLLSATIGFSAERAPT